jgi:AcrR family transcriptional regulator
VNSERAADWQARVVERSLRTATRRSIDRGSSLVRAAVRLLERSNGDTFTVHDVADEAGQSLQTLYQYVESKDDLLLAVFEESMGTYARMIARAVVDLSDPLERLGGGLVAALRMPEFSGTGVDRGLARLRLKLGEVEPDLVARSQQPVTVLMRDLVGGGRGSHPHRRRRGGDVRGAGPAVGVHHQPHARERLRRAPSPGVRAGVVLPRRPRRLDRHGMAGPGQRPAPHARAHHPRQLVAARERPRAGQGCSTT